MSTIFKIPFYKHNKSTLLSEIDNHLTIKDSYKVIVTCNTDHLVKLDAEYKQLKKDYLQAAWITADGMPIVWSSYLKRQPLERITGSDLLIDLLAICNQHHLNVAFICTNNILVNKLSYYIFTKYPEIKSNYVIAVDRFRSKPEYQAYLAEELKLDKVDVIIFGLGFPTSEEWLFKWGATTGATLGIAVGAGLEMVVGMKKRSPVWLQKIGLEWLYRAITDRRLIPRYVRNILYFPYLLTKI